MEGEYLEVYKSLLNNLIIKVYKGMDCASAGSVFGVDVGNQQSLPEATVVSLPC